MRHPLVESLHAARVMFGFTFLHDNHEVQLLLQILLCDSNDVSPEGFREHIPEPFARDDRQLLEICCFLVELV